MIQASEARKVQEQAKLTVVDEKLLYLETRILELAGENRNELHLFFPDKWRKPIIIEELRKAGYTVKEYRFGSRAKVTW